MVWQQGELARHQRPRPDDRHVADQHVPELRQLVEAGPPQQPPDPRRSLGVGQQSSVGAVCLAHGAELDHNERLASEAASDLVEHDRRSDRSPQRYRQTTQQRRRQHQHGAADRDIDEPFEQAVGAVLEPTESGLEALPIGECRWRRRRAKAQQIGQIGDAQLFCVGPLSQQTNRLEADLVVRRGDDDLGWAHPPQREPRQHALEVAEAAEDGDVVQHAPDRQPVVENADRPPTRLRGHLQQPRHQCCARPPADQEHRLPIAVGQPLATAAQQSDQSRIADPHAA